MIRRSRQVHIEPVPILLIILIDRETEKEKNMAANEVMYMAEMTRVLLAVQRKMEEQERVQNAPPPPLVINMYATPNANPNDGWGVLDEANNFFLHHGLITMVKANQFSGRTESDPNSHLSSFLDIYDTIRMNQVSKDVIRLKMFMFSLRDRTKHLFNGYDKSIIHSWEELHKLFLNT